MTSLQGFIRVGEIRSSNSVIVAVLSSIVVLLNISAVYLQACPNSRCWWPAAELSQANHPSEEETLPPGSPVCARGHVESVHHERDRDYYIWLCPSLSNTTKTATEPYPHYTMHGRRQDCVLGEIVPSIAVTVPHVGQEIELCGIWGQPRVLPDGTVKHFELDKEHGWTEIHPVIVWRVVQP